MYVGSLERRQNKGNRLTFESLYLARSTRVEGTLQAVCDQFYSREEHIVKFVFLVGSVSM